MFWFPYEGTTQKRSLRTSRGKKYRTLVDIEKLPSTLLPNRIRVHKKKANKHKVVCSFNTELGGRIYGEFQTVRFSKREEARIKLGVAKSENLKWRGKDSSMMKNVTRHTKEHQKQGVHCDLWVKRLASSKSFRNNSTDISHLQWKKKKMSVFASCWMKR